MRKILVALVIAVLGAGCEAVDVSTTEAITTTPPGAPASAAPSSSADPTAPEGPLAEQVASP